MRGFSRVHDLAFIAAGEGRLYDSTPQEDTEAGTLPSIAVAVTSQHPLVMW